MGQNFKIMVEGDFACFTRPEFKVERVSYDVPTPGAIEGLLKSIYWKPAIRYVITRILIFNKINLTTIKRNEVKDKILPGAMLKQMRGRDADPCIYAVESRSQRTSMVLTDVKYGIEFYIELTGLRDDGEYGVGKHYGILRRRIEKGQFFRMPCLGCSEFPVRTITEVQAFETGQISRDILSMGDVDLGYMVYKMQFDDDGIPINGNWDKPMFSDKARAIYYHPHMRNENNTVPRAYTDYEVLVDQDIPEGVELIDMI